LLARNLARGLAELHSIGIVHGDFATENILVKPDSFEVKVIDFDIASAAGRQISAAGNPDFISKVMSAAIQNKQKIEAKFQTDLYALALCCFLVLGDQKRKFFISLSEDGLDIYEKE
jgi:serine/threonine protein kinase